MSHVSALTGRVVCQAINPPRIVASLNMAKRLALVGLVVRLPWLVGILGADYEQDNLNTATGEDRMFSLINSTWLKCIMQHHM